MPLPDATKDKRIYQLLKNIDLGNLTFSEFQTAAQSVFAEPEAEDTLRRIVLVNLARMSVAGDWSGLTTAAASGSIMERGYKTGWYYNLNPIQMYTQTTQALNANKIRCMPFLVNKDTTFDRISTYAASTSGTADLSIGIYNMGTNGEPTTLVIEEQFSNISTGYHTATISEALTAGWYFYFVWCNESVDYGITNTTAGSLAYGLAPIYSFTSPSNYGGSVRAFPETYSAGAAPDLTSATIEQIEAYNVNMFFRAV